MQAKLFGYNIGIGRTINGGFGICWAKLGGPFGLVTIFNPRRFDVRHMICWTIYGSKGRTISIR